jgi:hypothetical protein
MTLRRTLRAGGAGVIRRLRRAGCYCRRATERIDPSWWVLSLETKLDWLPDQGSNLGPAD